MSSVASASRSRDVPRLTPGVLFRLSAVASAVAVGLVVVSAVLELGTTHWGIALVALPLLVANVVLAQLAYPALLRRTLVALVSFLVAIALGGVVAWSGDATWAAALHVGAAAVALGVALVVVAGAFRGEATPLASARDYLTLDEAADHDAAPPHRRGRDVRRRPGRAAARPLRGDDARARARLRRRVGSQSCPRPRHRRAHGQPDRAASRRVGPRRARPGARVRDPAVGDLVRAPRLGGECPDGCARARRQPLLRPRLHALAQALDAAEHRDRRRRRCGSAARRLRGGYRDRSRCRRSGSSSSSSSGRRRTSGRSR